MTQTNMTMCEQCGAALFDLDKHAAWHNDIETRIANVDRNLSDKLQWVHDNAASGEEFRVLDRNHEGVWSAIHELREKVGLPQLGA